MRFLPNHSVADSVVRALYLLPSGLNGSIAAQSGRSQVKTIHTTSFLRPSARGIVFPLGVHMGVDWLLARSHGLREHGVHVAIGSTGLEHRSPVNFASMIGVGARHDGTLVGVLHDRRIYFILNWFGSIGGLRTLQVGLGMRQMRGTRGVTAS